MAPRRRGPVPPTRNHAQVRQRSNLPPKNINPCEDLILRVRFLRIRIAARQGLKLEATLVVLSANSRLSLQRWQNMDTALDMTMFKAKTQPESCFVLSRGFRTLHMWWLVA